MSDFVASYTDRKVNEFMKKTEMKEGTLNPTKEQAKSKHIQALDAIANMDTYDALAEKEDSYKERPWASEYSEFSKEEIKDVARLMQITEVDSKVVNLKARDAKKNPLYYYHDKNENVQKERGYFDRKKLKKAAKAYTQYAYENLKEQGGNTTQYRKYNHHAKMKRQAMYALDSKADSPKLTYLQNRDNLAQNYKFVGDETINYYIDELFRCTTSFGSSSLLFKKSAPTNKEKHFISLLNQEEVTKLKNNDRAFMNKRVRDLFFDNKLDELYSYRLTHNGNLSKELINKSNKEM